MVNDDDDDSNSNATDQTESMSSDDAWMFPLVGSGVLFGLFVLFRLFSKDYVNMVLTVYFMIFGTSAVAATIRYVGRWFKKRSFLVSRREEDKQEKKRSVEEKRDITLGLRREEDE